MAHLPITLTILLASALLVASKKAVIEENAHVCHGAKVGDDGVVERNTIIFPGVEIPSHRVVPSDSYIVGQLTTEQLLDFVSSVQNIDKK